MTLGSKTKPSGDSPLVLTWYRHALIVGALLGTGLGIANQFIVHLTAVGDPPSAAVSGAAILCSAGTGTLWMAVAAAVTAPLIGQRWSRPLALMLHGVSAGVLALAYLGSLLLRAVSGAYLSLGAVLFGLNGNAHLIEAAASGFRWELVAAGVLTLVAIGGTAWLASRSLRRPARSARAAHLGAITAIAGVSLLPITLAAAPEEASPELALLASVLPGAPRTDGDSDTRGVTAGPPQGDGNQWAIAARAGDGPRPNLLLTMLESVPASHVGYAGYARPVTPHLDAIARRGHRFTRVWSTATHSNYAQMAVLSSLFPRRGYGLDTYRRLDYPRFLFHDLAAALGYRVAAISSQDENWQGMLRFQSTSTPLFRWHAPLHNGPRLDIGSELAAPDHVTIDQAITWLKAGHDEPWALYMNLQATHFPYPLPRDEPRPFQPDQPEGRYSYLRYSESQRAAIVNRYDNALAYVDRQLGRMAQYLQESGQLDNTLWIITSDHGELFSEHGLVTHGKSLFEGEARVPLVMHYPKRLAAKSDDRPVSHLDILPSIVDLLELPPHPAFQGRSVFEPDRELSTAPVYMNIQGLRTAEALVCWPWKVIVERSRRKVQLFQLERDPDEAQDVAAKEVRVAEALRGTLERQVRAQHAYHAADSAARAERFAPRMAACPHFPGEHTAVATEKASPKATSTAPDNPGG